MLHGAFGSHEGRSSQRMLLRATLSEFCAAIVKNMIEDALTDGPKPKYEYLYLCR